MNHAIGRPFAVWVAVLLCAMTHLGSAKAGQAAPLVNQNSDLAKLVSCAPGSFVVGVMKRLTDRINSGNLVCSPAVSPGQWSQTDSASINQDGFGEPGYSGGSLSVAVCPHNYFLSGFSFSTGKFETDHTFGAYQTYTLLTDLAPICIDASGYAFALPFGQLTNADNNNIKVTSWGGPMDPKGCPKGQAATGVAFNQPYVPSFSPPQAMADAALICSKLPLPAIIPAGAKTFHPHICRGCTLAKPH